MLYKCKRRRANLSLISRPAAPTARRPRPSSRSSTPTPSCSSLISSRKVRSSSLLTFLQTHLPSLSPLPSFPCHLSFVLELWQARGHRSLSGRVPFPLRRTSQADKLLLLSPSCIQAPTGKPTSETRLDNVPSLASSSTESSSEVSELNRPSRCCRKSFLSLCPLV